ncbi:hypothetical protein C2S51_018003 [Perilla frutescens var. frutescens]|nr:hypothetical protein C2S51_018003 [Perilla frutescens var. frutescens]
MRAEFGREWLGLVLRLRTISGGPLGTARGLFPRSAPKHISFLIPCLAFWFIWMERNSRKHRGVPFLVSHIIWQVQHHLHLLVSTGKLLPQHWLGCYPQVPFMPVADPVPRSLRSRMVSWRPPKAPWVKFNTDGAFSTDLQMAANGGGLVRDHTRSLLASFCAPLRAASSFDAEFQALLHGLRLAV